MAHITFPLKTNDDKTITCIACGLPECEYEIQVFGDGRRVWLGLHHKCASHHESRTRWVTEEEDGEDIILDEYDKPKLEEKLIEKGWAKPGHTSYISYPFAVSGVVADYEEAVASNPTLFIHDPPDPEVGESNE